MKVLVTGGAGFIGSHIAERYAKEGHDIVVFDNLSRSELLKKPIRHADYNKKYLEQFKNVKFIKGDIRNEKEIAAAAKDTDVIFHAAAQTAVTTSITDPRPDFEANIVGTFNVMEAARKSGKNTSIIHCSTNKVFGSNVNKIRIVERQDHYEFEPSFKAGVPEPFSIDMCEHTPYGVSKLAGDLYAQDYAHVYGLKTGVFRMSCIYGTRQFGVEDQGWVAWFAIATILGKPLTIYGDGKQVRDVLYVSDLIDLYDRFLKSSLKHGVFNTGGGPKNTLSLLQLLDLLEKFTGKRSKLSFSDWRPSDQKVFVADISAAKSALGWEPKVSPEEGVKKLVGFVSENKKLFE
ncbi:SDR family NAD(P)-dependent oxidoreductase [Candidatus Woesearchaeota archaeon]|nr:SDR family NAD(P)-dependent oxidoreductase [Candidatus Woesearchaeota archaeon]